MPKTVADLRRSYRRYGIRCSANAPFMPPAHTDGRKAGSDGRFPVFFVHLSTKGTGNALHVTHGKRLLLLLLSIGCCLAGFAAESYTLRGRVIDRLTRRPSPMRPSYSTDRATRALRPTRRDASPSNASPGHLPAGGLLHRLSQHAHARIRRLGRHAPSSRSSLWRTPRSSTP